MSLADDVYNLTRIFFPSLNMKCTHAKINPSVEQAYCPDCGKLIKNEWYVARCSCCGVKIKAMVRNGKVVTQNNYCSNCGSQEYTIEKLEKINFIDINFAALLKIEVEDDLCCSSTSCWEEKNIEPLKLPVQYL